MKILHIISSLSPKTGGPAKAVMELSRALAHLGQEVSIFSTDHGMEEPKTPAFNERNGVRVEIFRRVWPQGYFYSSDLKQRLETCAHGFDLVHIHGLWLYPTLIASRICHRKKIPYVIRPCGMLDRYSLTHHPLRKGIYGLLVERNNLNLAQAIHFTTEGERERSKGYRLKSRSVVIPLGLDLKDYLNLPPRGEFRKRHPELDGKKIILFLGRISFKKGLDLLSLALSELMTKAQDIHWVIAGSDDEGFGIKLTHIIRQKRIEHRVTFTGFINGREKLSLLRDSDVFCLPSYQENFSLATVEAMAVGLPVVVSDQVNLHQEILSAGAGLVTRCDTRELTNALDQLLEDEALRRRMGEKGQKLVLEKYQWDRIAKEMIKFYESIARSYQR